LSLFVDTSVWYAATDSGDVDNAGARAVLSRGDSLITTDHVLAETWRLIRYHLHGRAAEQFWEGLRSGLALIEPVGLADLETAWQIGRAWKDQDFSLVDRTSFAVMRRLGVDRAASFDEHFAVFRFGPRNRHAFTILR